MKTKFTFALCLLAAAFTSEAQNQITTPTGQPLVIGNQGVKLANLNSGSATGTANGKVLSVDANGMLFLAPASSGGGGSTTPWATSGSTISYNAGNVGIGTSSPQQRLDVNGSINLPTGSALRFNNVPFLSAPGVNNLFVGAESGMNNTSGSGNIFLGDKSGKANLSGAYNVFLGSNAGSNNTASSGVFIGTNAGLSNNTGASNVMVGYNSGQANISGTQNVFFGVNSGFNNTNGSYNLFLGANSGFTNGAGNYNVFLGYRSGQQNTSGSQNIAIGLDAGHENTTGNYNVFVGGNAGYNNQIGSYNLFFGLNAGLGNTSGDRSLGMGFNAGANNTTGSDNTFLGFDANPSVGTLTNVTAIGSHASVTASNSLILGGTGGFQVKVGVGNTAPTARLHVTSEGTTATGVRFENLPTSTGTIYHVYVDGSGNLMRASTAGAREAFEGSDRNWTLTADNHLINNNPGGIMIGTGLSSTPEGYKLYVSDGILTERVKVAVKSTADWRDNVLQDDYKLRSVEDVESFIKQNKHLPGVPSAQEMVENGNDLQKTDAVLLEKVEEMMLYIIELKKENAALKNKMEGIEQKISERK